MIVNEYYLMINGNRFEKNIYRAMVAFDLLFSKELLSDKKVVITGGLSTMLNWVKNKNKFIIMPYVSKEDFNNLFKNAYAFVYPSLNEGFGYPPLIAMNYSIPVLASSSTSINEICENAALYFNPYKIDEISNRILQIENSVSTKEKLKLESRLQVDKIKLKQNKDLQLLVKKIFQ